MRLVPVGESNSVFADPTFGSKAFFVSADGSVVWPMGRLMQTETASASWTGRVKGSTMRSRFFKLDREPPC
jgi:hypothetical protein